MRKEKIIVYNYFSGGSILHRIDEDAIPEMWEVDAYCVGDFFAVFKHPKEKNTTCFAGGDDGHWWFAGRHHMEWDSDMCKAYMEYIKDANYKS
jgi:hypothetical protein